MGNNMNQQKRNYQKELEAIIDENKGTKPTLLLHSCCAPCSSYCMEYLLNYFDVTVLYYNPNITNEEEYNHRINEQERLINAFNEKYLKDSVVKIKLIKGDYKPEIFLERVKGYEDCKEGGDRCRICFAIRLEEAAELAKENGFDYFTTTLTISPLKNADALNEIGNMLGKKNDVKFLPSDFKKKNGYKRSVELSNEYGLYRQNYCGCEFSKNEAENRNIRSLN